MDGNKGNNDRTVKNRTDEQVEKMKTKEEKFKELKEAMIYKIESTKTDNYLDLFKELLSLIWTEGFASGQEYALNTEENY